MSDRYIAAKESDLRTAIEDAVRPLKASLAAAESRAESAESEARANGVVRDAWKSRALEAEARAAALAEALREVEWRGEGGFWEEACCPVCEVSEGRPHLPDCRLAAALAPPEAKP